MRYGKPKLVILGSLNEYFLIFLFLSTIFTLALQVLARTFFSTAFPWAEEVSRYLFVYFVFGGAALGFKRGVFISVDLVEKILPKKIQIAFAILIDIIILIFFIMIAYVGFKLFLGSKGQLTPALEMEIRYVYLAFPIFFSQMSVYAFLKIFEHLKPLGHD